MGVRVDRRVMRRRSQSLKEVITVRAIELSAEHAAPLETESQSHKDMGRCDRASRSTLCVRSRHGRPA